MADKISVRLGLNFRLYLDLILFGWCDLNNFGLNPIICSKGLIVIQVLFRGIILTHVICHSVFFFLIFFKFDLKSIGFMTPIIFNWWIIIWLIFRNPFALSLFDDRGELLRNRLKLFFVILLRSLNMIDLVVIFYFIWSVFITLFWHLILLNRINICQIASKKGFEKAMLMAGVLLLNLAKFVLQKARLQSWMRLNERLALSYLLIDQFGKH